MDKCKNKNKNFILYAVILSMFYRTRVRAEEKRKTKEETADINHVKVKLSLARKDRLFRAPPFPSTSQSPRDFLSRIFSKDSPPCLLIELRS